jgi:hypothetical protein
MCRDEKTSPRHIFYERFRLSPLLILVFIVGILNLDLTLGRNNVHRLVVHLWHPFRPAHIWVGECLWLNILLVECLGILLELISFRLVKILHVLLIEVLSILRVERLGVLFKLISLGLVQVLHVLLIEVLSVLFELIPLGLVQVLNVLLIEILSVLLELVPFGLVQVLNILRIGVLNLPEVLLVLGTLGLTLEVLSSLVLVQLVGHPLVLVKGVLLEFSVLCLAGRSSGTLVLGGGTPLGVLKRVRVQISL